MEDKLLNPMNTLNVTYLKEDQEVQEMMRQHLMQDIYGHGTLAFEMREYITLALMTLLDGKELIKDHVCALLAYGTKPELVKEVIYQVIPYGGLLCVNHALAYVNEAFHEAGIKETPSMRTVTKSTRFAQGFAKQCEVFGKEHIQAAHDHAPEDLKHLQTQLSAHCFGDFYTRKGLDMKQRELLTFCVIASFGGCENQLHAHAMANLTAGNTRQDLIEAMTQCQPYIGYPRTLNAIAIIEEVTQEEEKR